MDNIKNNDIYEFNLSSNEPTSILILNYKDFNKI